MPQGRAALALQFEEMVAVRWQATRRLPLTVGRTIPYRWCVPAPGDGAYPKGERASEARVAPHLGLSGYASKVNQAANLIRKRTFKWLRIGRCGWQDGCEFLIASMPDGSLDLRDVYVMDHESGIYARPATHGKLPAKPVQYHEVQWKLRFDGDSLKGKFPLPPWEKVMHAQRA